MKVNPSNNAQPTYRVTAKMDPGKVNAEIERLKEKKTSLQQQLQKTGAGSNERRNIAAQLAQLDAELAMKDNPQYKKQNAAKSYGPVTKE